MIDYNALRQEIINTLMGRPEGTQIQPDNHQHYALNMLDYIRELELALQSSLMGFADENTIPIQPDDARVSYIGAVAPNYTSVYSNFYDAYGNAITINNPNASGLLVIFIWNMEFWSYETVPAGQNTYYSYNIRKTYDSIANMNADVNSPVSTDNQPISVGELVSVVNPNDSSENGIYTYEGTSWRFQTSLTIFEEDINTMITNVTDSISGTIITKIINLGMINNPVIMIDCDGDTYTNIGLSVVFNKFNDAKIFIKNIGNNTLILNYPIIISYSPIFNLSWQSIYDNAADNQIQAGEIIEVNLSCFNYFDTVLNNYVPTIRQRLTKTNTIAVYH